jgi:hypothetical protein
VSAFNSVITYGGVLEHPAFSDAWKKYDLMRPVVGKWIKCRLGDYWVCEVWQSAYGHKARKRTWLLYQGNKNPPEMNWGRPEAKYQIGFHDQRGKLLNKPTISGKAASATPMALRNELISIALDSRG